MKTKQNNEDWENKFLTRKEVRALALELPESVYKYFATSELEFIRQQRQEAYEEGKQAGLKEHGALCPKCNDYLDCEHKGMGHYEYSCFGCDEIFSFTSKKQAVKEFAEKLITLVHYNKDDDSYVVYYSDIKNALEVYEGK